MVMVCKEMDTLKSAWVVLVLF